MYEVLGAGQNGQNGGHNLDIDIDIDRDIDIEIDKEKEKDIDIDTDIEIDTETDTDEFCPNNVLCPKNTESYFNTKDKYMYIFWVLNKNKYEISIDIFKKVIYNKDTG